MVVSHYMSPVQRVVVAVQKFLRGGDPRSGREAPPLSGCLRCSTNWAEVEGHITYYEPSAIPGNEGSFTPGGQGCFPLCELCWSELSPTERLPFYRKLWAIWMSQANEADLQENYLARWHRIESAVLAGR